MLEILVAVCLHAEPQRCKEIRLAYSGDNVLPYQCMLGAQSQIARWSEGYPEWRIVGYRCERHRSLSRG